MGFFHLSSFLDLIFGITSNKPQNPKKAIEAIIFVKQIDQFQFIKTNCLNGKI